VPFFYTEASVVFTSYLSTLQNLSNPQVQELQLAVFFLQNSTLLHWSLVVYAYLNQHVPNQWIGCAGPTSYLARSQRITSCGFFIRVYTKACVYQTAVADNKEWWYRTEAAVI
jgi:hypothetical protein